MRQLRQAVYEGGQEISDWSCLPLLENPAYLWLQLRRKATLVEIHYSLNSLNYTLLETAYLDRPQTVQVGLVYACPENASCQITFANFLLITESDRYTQLLDNTTN